MKLFKKLELRTEAIAAIIVNSFGIVLGFFIPPEKFLEILIVMIYVNSFDTYLRLLNEKKRGDLK